MANGEIEEQPLSEIFSQNQKNKAIAAQPKKWRTKYAKFAFTYG